MAYHEHMKPRLRISRRSRLRLALLATFALLLQQFAFAAHACMLDGAPVPMAANCEGMQMPHPIGDALCGQHCARATPAPLPDAQAPSVPAMLVLPFPAMTHVAATLPQLSPAHCRLPHPSPPITSLYCSRQI